jgi:hypothetical protein
MLTVDSLSSAYYLSESRLVVDPVETFEVTTVMSSLSMITSWAGENIWVGSDALLITENVSLHLNATLPLIAPNRHICGKTVLCRFLVLEESARANPDARIRPLTHVSVDRAYQAKSVGGNSLVTILIAIRRSQNL